MFITWILIGLIAGAVASKLVNQTGRGSWLDLLVGMMGGLLGGVIPEALGYEGISGFNFYSLLVAFIGASVLLLLFHTFTDEMPDG
ncbi:GlsB/YeaQ/YmgE family stress response membrane protein [Chitinimonas sp. BJYL2]|uniref:GlsB/YeaQ/YmgE family stress response membrane protein n=1 Tax=Chitinimonas sp. BJYL2 TaxID=2976696 RepID=UPI0022B341BD|nr:GlsB/YeaQ/YmgE family stress response membrane protein [Chitinimonas sp. BJYL2]